MTDPRLDELLQAWRDVQEQGRVPIVSEVCRDCPDLAEELARRLDRSASALSSISAIRRCSLNGRIGILTVPRFPREIRVLVVPVASPAI